jgi:hypothetical protein
MWKKDPWNYPLSEEMVSVIGSGMVYKSKTGSESEVLRKNVGVMNPFEIDTEVGDFEPDLEAAGDGAAAVLSGKGEDGGENSKLADARRRLRQRNACNEVLEAVNQVLSSAEFTGGRGLDLLSEINDL